MKKIPLTKGLVALVDDEDYPRLSVYRWYASKAGGVFYASRNDYPRKRVYLHRMVAVPPDGKVVDHINGNTLDNRRGNLRVCSRSENARNAKRHSDSRTGFKGVSWHGHSSVRPWQAGITVDGKRIALGLFATREQAAAAYDLAAIQYFGEFARLNFPFKKGNKYEARLS